MIKLPFLLINFIGLFFLHLISVSEVVVENIAPSSMPPGQQVLVEVAIDKNDIQGFAKMEIVLPQGFIATPADTKGASFTFSERKVRFVWMTLPTEQTFKVSYYLECDPNFSGKYEVKGTFSYINNNQRTDYTIPTQQVLVTQDAVAQTNTNQEDSQTTTDQSDNNESTNNETSQIVENNAASAATDLQCERTITRLSDNEFRVDLRIINSNIQGFAKVVDVAPELAKTQKIQDAGATVTTDKNAIKFVWFEMPVSPIIEVSYKITTLAASENYPVVNGKLSFVENNNPKEMAVIQVEGFGDTSNSAIAENNSSNSSTNNSSTSSDTSNNDVASNQDQTSSSADTSNSSSSDNASASSQSNNTKANDTASAASSNKGKTTTSNAVSNVPQPENGVNYKVQILAAHRVVNKTYFKQMHSYSEGFNIENHEGWVKYTTGLYGEYKQARDERERLKNSYSTLPGPFVTAYNNGERITVQEALLISNQQWYK